ncbi:MAG: HNH endonuclease [Bacilli bacterium]|jgi:5-methylcytosine-specific restriction endonuclease McrA|nr:HNH endonuclease [Bacilli bacterium]
MKSNPDIIERFYRSDAWQKARLERILLANGRCEKCGRVGQEVHHKIKLTPMNVLDPNISLNQDNLILLCKECHNEEHNRFQKESEFDSEGNLVKTKTKKR